MATKLQIKLQQQNKRLNAAIKRAKERNKQERSQNGEGDDNGALTTKQRRQAALGTPFIRKGENVMGSRGYCFYRVAGLLTKSLDAEQCKLELQISNKMKSYMRNCAGFHATPNSIMAPLEPSFFISEAGYMDKHFIDEMKTLLWAGTKGVDPDEVKWLTQKFMTPDRQGGRGNNGLYTPDTMRVGAGAQSWVQQNIGGAFVPYPDLGPIIPLLRNTSSILQAGARLFPLPMSGRISFPRQTTPTLGYHVGESEQITPTTVGSDQLSLAAKKIGAIITINNELIQHGGPAVEALYKEDMVLTLGLTFDFDCIAGAGSDTITQGLIGMPGVTAYLPKTAANIAANGNAFGPEDTYAITGLIKSHNAENEGWIFSPVLFWNLMAIRFSTVTAGDQQGGFLWDLTRSAGDGDYNRLVGKKVIESNNVPVNRVKGTSSDLTTVLAGMWSKFYAAMWGTIEFLASDLGTPAFEAYQTKVRAVMQADAGAAVPGAFVYVDNLVQANTPRP